MGFVYAIMDQHNRVKIGIDTGGGRRKAVLQTGNADELKEVWTLDHPNYKRIETALHHELYPWKIRSEWFSNGRAIVRALILYFNRNVMEMDYDLYDLVKMCSPRTTPEELMETAYPKTETIETDPLLKRAIKELRL